MLSLTMINKHNTDKEAMHIS